MGGQLIPPRLRAVTSPRISVVVPAYNEERDIVATIKAIQDRLDADGQSYEVIVVDNASTDATRERLAPMLTGGTVRLLVNDANRGKGHSVKRGMPRAPCACTAMPTAGRHWHRCPGCSS